MNICRKDLCKKIKSISEQIRFAVLATDSNGCPYTNLIGFLLSQDLKSLYFFISKNSRKYENILNNPNICILMDNRDKYKDKTFLITAITAIGRASIVGDPPKSILEKYLEKNIELKQFTESTSNVLVKVNITEYIVVNRFQEIINVEFS